MSNLFLSHKSIYGGEGMIDIHTHILFGVDDGARTLEESIALIKHEITRGITDIFLTPHLISGSHQTASKETILAHFNQLVQEVQRLQLSVRLHLGSEIYYVDSLLERIKKNEFFSLGDSNQYLVEFSTRLKTLNLEEVIYQSGLENIQIMIAHPERYIHVDIAELLHLKPMGALLQINQSSLDGKEGFTIKRRAKKLVKLGIVDFIASDLHHL